MRSSYSSHWSSIIDRTLCSPNSHT